MAKKISSVLLKSDGNFITIDEFNVSLRLLLLYDPILIIFDFVSIYLYREIKTAGKNTKQNNIIRFGEHK